jgi:hypothetical protein
VSIWSRISNLFRGNRVDREIDEELESHIAEPLQTAATPKMHAVPSVLHYGIARPAATPG